VQQVTAEKGAGTSLLGKRCGDVAKMASARIRGGLPGKLRKLKDCRVTAGYGVHFVDRQFVDAQIANFIGQLGHIIHLFLKGAIPSQLMLAGVRGAVRLRCDTYHAAEAAGLAGILRPAPHARANPASPASFLESWRGYLAKEAAN
jgi:hypothetical protein